MILCTLVPLTVCMSYHSIASGCSERRNTSQHGVQQGPDQSADTAQYHCGGLIAGAAAELQGVTGVWAAVRYLVAVGGDHTALVKKHAR